MIILCLKNFDKISRFNITIGCPIIIIVTDHEKLCHKLKILKIVFLVQLECADYNHCYGVAVS